MPDNVLMRKLVDATSPAGLAGIIEANPGILDELARPGNLVEVAQTALELEPHEREYVEAIPARLREALRAALLDAINGGLEIFVQYVPAYEFELRLFEYGNQLVVHLRGPFTGGAYPRDSYTGPAAS